MSKEDCKNCQDRDWCMVVIHGTPGRCCTMCIHRDKSIREEPCNTCESNHSNFLHHNYKERSKEGIDKE